jgi:hypothetical protein
MSPAQRASKMRFNVNHAPWLRGRGLVAATEAGGQYGA